MADYQTIIQQALSENKRIQSQSSYISLWEKWYKGKFPSFHNYKIWNGKKNVRMEKKSLKMAKKVCEDWASLLMNEKVQIVVSNQELLDKLLLEMDFYTKANKSVEYGFALSMSALVLSPRAIPCLIPILGKFIDHHKDEMPDLIIMDGGKIQVNAALETFVDKNVKPPLIIGLVKNNNHQTNGIVYHNRTIKLDKESNLYNFLANIQNEVHNTAISFHRKKHEKSLFDTSILPNIEGLSKAKMEMLLEKYHTTDNIKKATISELSQIIDVAVARALKKAL